MHGTVINLCLYIFFRRTITYSFLPSFHRLIIHNCLVTNGEHMTIKAQILVIIQSQWHSSAEENSLNITTSKVTNHL